MWFNGFRLSGFVIPANRLYYFQDNIAVKPLAKQPLVFGSKFKVSWVVALGILSFYSRAALNRKVLVIVSVLTLPSNNKVIQSDKKSLSRFLQRTAKTNPTIFAV